MGIYDFRACPQCGSDSVGGNGFLGPSYSCGNCDWRYKQGLLGERGTHPEQFERYCSDCRTVYATADEADHTCTVVGALEECDGPLAFADLADSLSDYRSTGEVEKGVKTGVWQRTVAVQPDGRLVRRGNPTGRTDMHRLILDMADENQYAGKQQFLDATDIGGDWGEEFVQQCLRELVSDGTMDGRPGHRYRLTSD